ncbi:hypothetical protein CDAR_597391 [Caerostris darwini]|uniref:Uncharacterized protein n=1 Tax=Caerostris darwini TaxID=1538125 RepID=A0AAV4VQG7_9ARAC|nr:hypothetical protein CDAR_597391 [Caerostris darwini]
MPIQRKYGPWKDVLQILRFHSYVKLENNRRNNTEHTMKSGENGMKRLKRVAVIANHRKLLTERLRQARVSQEREEDDAEADEVCHPDRSMNAIRLMSRCWCGVPHSLSMNKNLLKSSFSPSSHKCSQKTKSVFRHTPGFYRQGQSLAVGGEDPLTRIGDRVSQAACRRNLEFSLSLCHFPCFASTGKGGWIKV